MMLRGVLVWIVVLVTAAMAPGESQADDRRFDLGLRYSALHAGGSPAADVPYLGLVFRYAMNDRWTVAGALDKVEFDFESPAAHLGLQQDTSVPTVDSKVEGTQLSVWIDRQYGKAPSRLRWFWNAGLGFTAPSASAARGPLQGGGTFDIQTDVGTEIIPTFAGGARWFLSERWLLELAGRLDHHFADWTVQDQVSGDRTTVGSYTTRGAHIVMAVRF